MDILNELSEKNGDKEAGTNLKRKATGAVEVDDVPKKPNTGSDVRENSQLSPSGCERLKILNVFDEDDKNGIKEQQYQPTLKRHIQGNANRSQHKNAEDASVMIMKLWSNTKNDGNDNEDQQKDTHQNVYASDGFVNATSNNNIANNSISSGNEMKKRRKKRKKRNRSFNNKNNIANNNNNNNSNSDQDCVFIAEVNSDQKTTIISPTTVSSITESEKQPLDGNENNGSEVESALTCKITDSKYIQPEYGSNNQDASTSLRDEPEVMIIDDGLTTNMHIGQRFVNRVRQLSKYMKKKSKQFSGQSIVQEGPSATVNASTTVVKNRSVKELCDALGITHLPSSMHVMNLIQEKVQKFAAEFSEFEQHIWTHYSSNAQNDYTFSWKMEVREHLLRLIRKVYPGANMFAVGSTVNGCGAYNSDMDLCLCLPHPALGYDTDRQYAVKALSKIHRVLAYASKGLVQKCACIPAKVPILKLEMGGPYSELEIDINCNNVAGIYNSHLLHYYSRIDDCFPALCLVVKHWAIIANINDAMSGTLNSYSLILMVLHFLQCCTMPPVLPNLQELNPDIFNAPRGVEQLELFRDVPQLPQRPLNHASVGELLIAFFDYYSKFDFDTKAISVARGCVFDRSELAAETKRYKIFIEEPFDHQNTARCVTRVERLRAIKTAFISARNAFLGPTSGPPKLANIGVH